MHMKRTNSVLDVCVTKLPLAPPQIKAIRKAEKNAISKKITVQLTIDFLKPLILNKRFIFLSF